jgi:hypothetical protein
MNQAQMLDIARGAIERHLGDAADEAMSADAIYDAAFVLAHDALIDRGVEASAATPIAQQAAQAVAQP